MSGAGYLVVSKKSESMTLLSNLRKVKLMQARADRYSVTKFAV